MVKLQLGSIREAPLGMVSGSFFVSDPPGNIGDKPGNVVTQFPLVRLRAGCPAGRHTEICVNAEDG